MSRQVTCVNKRDRPNPHERILNIGGVDNGVRWKRSQIDAIADVERDPNSYYVVDRVRGGNTVWVIVRTSQFGNKYLTTQADGDSQNNLLALDECP
jgi:hypothetical protein